MSTTCKHTVNKQSVGKMCVNNFVKIWNWSEVAEKMKPSTTDSVLLQSYLQSIGEWIVMLTKAVQDKLYRNMHTYCYGVRHCILWHKVAPLAWEAAIYTVIILPTVMVACTFLVLRADMPLHSLSFKYIQKTIDQFSIIWRCIWLNVNSLWYIM